MKHNSIPSSSLTASRVLYVDVSRKIGTRFGRATRGSESCLKGQGGTKITLSGQLTTPFHISYMARAMPTRRNSIYAVWHERPVQAIFL